MVACSEGTFRKFQQILSCLAAVHDERTSAGKRMSTASAATVAACSSREIFLDIAWQFPTGSTSSPAARCQEPVGLLEWD